MKSRLLWLILALVAVAAIVLIYSFYTNKNLSGSSQYPISLKKGTSKIFLSPSAGSYKNSEAFNVAINVDTADSSVAAVDVVIDYDTDKLEVIDADGDQTNGTQIATGNVFAKNIKVNKVSEGKIIIDALSIGGESTNFTGKGILGTINFKAKALGTAKVEFDFTKGATSGTMLAYDGKNILDAVTNASYTVE